MDHLKILDTHCPHCGKALDSSENADDSDRKPEPGDPSVCNRCAGISVLSPDMLMEIPDRETLDLWRTDAELWAAIDKAVAIVKSRKHYRP